MTHWMRDRTDNYGSVSDFTIARASSRPLPPHSASKRNQSEIAEGPHFRIRLFQSTVFSRALTGNWARPRILSCSDHREQDVDRSRGQVDHPASDREEVICAPSLGCSTSSVPATDPVYNVKSHGVGTRQNLFPVGLADEATAGNRV
jgi:hypothetical protein